MLAETVGAIAAESGSTLGASFIVTCRPVNRFPIMVDVAVMPGQVVFVGSEATRALREGWC
jgi:hypothetical protein